MIRPATSVRIVLAGELANRLSSEVRPGLATARSPGASARLRRPRQRHKSSEWHIWQAAEIVEPILGSLADICNTLQIIVVVEEAEQWGDREQMDGQDWLKVSSPQVGVLELRFTSAAQVALAGADNRAEREMLATLLEGLTVMAAEAEGPPVELDIPAAVDRHAPFGVKKKLMVLDTSVNLRLLPERLPSARMIQEADVELLLNEGRCRSIGSHRIRSDRGLRRWKEMDCRVPDQAGSGLATADSRASGRRWNPGSERGGRGDDSTEAATSPEVLDTRSGGSGR